MSDRTRARVLQPPAALALDAQTRITSALADLDVVVLNPRRDEWDATWRQSIDNPQFREQVDWELDAQARATVIAMYFSPSTQAGLLVQGQRRDCVCSPQHPARRGSRRARSRRTHPPDAVAHSRRGSVPWLSSATYGS